MATEFVFVLCSDGTMWLERRCLKLSYEVRTSVRECISWFSSVARGQCRDNATASSHISVIIFLSSYASFTDSVITQITQTECAAVPNWDVRWRYMGTFAARLLAHRQLDISLAGLQSWRSWLVCFYRELNLGLPACDLVTDWNSPGCRFTCHNFRPNGYKHHCLSSGMFTPIVTAVKTSNLISLTLHRSPNTD
jgi:hypothetical protein